MPLSRFDFSSEFYSGQPVRYKVKFDTDRVSLSMCDSDVKKKKSASDDLKSLDANVFEDCLSEKHSPCLLGCNASEATKRR